MEDTPLFNFVQPRSSVEIHLPDNQVISGPRGNPVGEFLTILQGQVKNPIVGAIVNYQLRELTFPITVDSVVKPVTMNDADGMRFYRRSLTFLLDTAFHKLFPNAILTIDHSVVSGGFFCQIYNRLPLSEHELTQLENQMWKLVEKNQPFVRKEYPLDTAIQYFIDRGYNDKISLLKHRKKDHDGNRYRGN